MAVSATLQRCIDAWNAHADKYNQWTELDADERCEWCLEYCIILRPAKK